MIRIVTYAQAVEITTPAIVTAASKRDRARLALKDDDDDTEASTEIKAFFARDDAAARLLMRRPGRSPETALAVLQRRTAALRQGGTPRRRPFSAFPS